MIRRIAKLRLHKRTTLDTLTDATSLLQMAKQDHDTLIDRAIAEGHSERAIAKAAGVSGPAINQRKRKMRADGITVRDLRAAHGLEPREGSK